MEIQEMVEKKMGEIVERLDKIKRAYFLLLLFILFAFFIIIVMLVFMV